MHGYENRSTAERVREYMGSSTHRDHLELYGWTVDVPIILAAPFDHIENVMGLVSLQRSTAMVAVADSTTNNLDFLWVSLPCPDLRRVEACSSTMNMSDFLERVSGSTPATFRMKYWDNSAVSYRLPICSQDPEPILRNYRLRAVA